MMSSTATSIRSREPAAALVCLLFFLALTPSVGCRRRQTAPATPTELMVPVTAKSAPILGEVEDDEPAALTLHHGDLVFSGRDQLSLQWHAAMEGGPASRIGTTFELRATSGSGTGYGFRTDFGAPVRVPTARWICRHNGLRLDQRAGCESSLVRARTRTGTVVAWMSSAIEPTPVAILRRGAVKRVVVDPASVGRLVEVGSTTLLLLTARTVSPDGKQTTARLVPIRIDGGPIARLRSIPLDEIDARDEQRVITRMAQFQLVDGVVHVVGSRRVVKAADASELENVPIDERHRLAELPADPDPLR